MVGNTDGSLASLRAITYRLSSTANKQLPHVAPQIASQLWNCKDLLSTNLESRKHSNESQVLVHRFRTHLSSLLQDRSIEGRWAAIVLAKATVEASGVEGLSKSATWVRSLLGILKKPDPPTTRCLAVITLTRIFMLTWDNSNLVREITTPALPAFISTCLSNAENQRCSSSELQTTLEAFSSLIPRHPTIFRTNENQIRLLLGKILSGADNVSHDAHYTESHRQVAQRLLVSLHRCSPKQGAADKWDQTFKSAVRAAHATCDHLFRSVVEDWRSVAGFQPSAQPGILLQGEAEMDSDEVLCLGGWKGVYAGSERLVTILNLISTHMRTATADGVCVRLGLLADLLERLFSILVPDGKHITVQINAEISKDEREALFAVMPEIHISAFRLVNILLLRFGASIASLVQSLVAQIVRTFEAERANVNLRTAVYITLASILVLQGPTMVKQDAADIESIIRSCCHDLLPADSGSSTSSLPQTNGLPSKPLATAHGLNQQSSHPTSLDDLRGSAQALLPACFSQLNPVNINGRLRVLMERTAVLTQHKEALVACVLNPSMNNKKSGAQASLLPLLARLFPSASEVEALLRPRMPVIWSGSHTDNSEGMDGNDGDDDIDIGDINNTATSNVGREKAVDTVPTENIGASVEVGEYGNELQAASYEGDEEMVEALINRGENVNAQGGKYGNALQAAAFRGYEKIVGMLIDNGADINAQGGTCGNALVAASSEGCEKVVKMLINKGADVNAGGWEFGSALWGASFEGYKKIVEMLIDAGADVNARDEKYGSALVAASQQGHHQIAEMLLDKGADIEAQGWESGSALIAAACEGHGATVQMLINRGANVNAEGGEYGNALQAASNEGHENIAQMLSEQGADFDVDGGFYEGMTRFLGSDGRVPQPSSHYSSLTESEDSDSSSDESAAIRVTYAASDKRGASGTSDPERLAKRLRPSPVAETTAASAAEKPSGSASGVAPSDGRARVVPEQEPSSSFVTAPEPSQPTAAEPAGPLQSAAAASRMDVDDGDDSDFEMPPLTMEPDTDSEAEEVDDR